MYNLNRPHSYSQYFAKIIYRKLAIGQGALRDLIGDCSDAGSGCDQNHTELDSGCADRVHQTKKTTDFGVTAYIGDPPRRQQTNKKLFLFGKQQILLWAHGRATACEIYEMDAVNTKKASIYSAQAFLPRCDSLLNQFFKIPPSFPPPTFPYISFPLLPPPFLKGGKKVNNL